MLFRSRIDASKYPLQADWDRLRGALARVIKECLTDWRPRQVGSTWTLTLQPLQLGQIKLADGYISYSLLLLAPHHANEQRNIESKIEGACVNLSKHAGALGARTGRMLLIRIPESASAPECVNCAQLWLTERPDARVDAVILYQPGVAASSIDAPAGIIHFIAVATGPGFERWRHTIDRPGLALQARVLVGLCTNQPTKLIGLNGAAMGERYVRQRGQIYSLGQNSANGDITGNVSILAPGIMVHSVMRIPGQQGEMVLSGKFPDDHKLALYS